MKTLTLTQEIKITKVMLEGARSGYKYVPKWANETYNAHRDIPSASCNKFKTSTEYVKHTKKIARKEIKRLETWLKSLTYVQTLG